MTPRLLATALLALSVACNSKSATPTAPAPATPTPPAVEATHTITGSVGAGNLQWIGANVTIIDGPDAGRTARTGEDGRYTISGLKRAGFTIRAHAPGYIDDSHGVTFREGVPTVTQNFTLLPERYWQQAGVGDMVFDMPRYITRVRITGRYDGNSTNFVVYVNGRLVVNEILGRSWPSTTYDGVLAVTGGETRIQLSSGVGWTFTEVR